MALLLADENFRLPVVTILRLLGHDVLTIQEAGLDNQGFPESAILATATAQRRSVLTHDRDYLKLHVHSPGHAGILFCTSDRDSQGLAQRIHAALTAHPTMLGQLPRIYRPSRPRPSTP